MTNTLMKHHQPASQLQFVNQCLFYLAQQLASQHAPLQGIITIFRLANTTVAMQLAILLTINNLLADLLIHQTFFAKCLKRGNLPNFSLAKLSHYTVLAAQSVNLYKSYLVAEMLPNSLCWYLGSFQKFLVDKSPDPPCFACLEYCTHLFMMHTAISKCQHT